MQRSSPSERLRLLTVCISLAGMLCLSLSELLPWALFTPLAAIHVLLWWRLFDREILKPGPALVILVLAFASEAIRIFMEGRYGIIPAVRDLIIALALARLFMKKTLREIHQIVGISFAQCLLATIFTTSPLFLLGIALMVILTPMTLAALDAEDFSTARRADRPSLAHWAVVTMGIILTASILFYVLPRPSSTIIRHRIARQNQVTFPEDVDLKESGRSGTNDLIVMRVVWPFGTAPKQFYLSGTRLEGISPDGFYKEKSRGSIAPVAGGFTDRLILYPTSLNSQSVFFPFWLCAASPRNYLFNGSNLYWAGDPPPVYEVWTSRRPGPSHPGSTRLPDGFSTLSDLAVKTAGQGDAHMKMKRLSSFLRTSYAYTLTPQPVPAGESGIVRFLFTNRKGSCEHFASALAAMARASGIPARVVTGFLVDEFNDTGDYFIVRAKDAHAWVEYWDGTWYTADATPSGRTVPAVRFHLLDELRFRWIRWVIQYSLEDQINIAVQIASAPPRITRHVDSAVRYAVFLLLFGTALAGCCTIIRNRMLPPYEKILRAVSRKGVHLPRNSPHEEHLDIIGKEWPSMEGHFRGYLKQYLIWRFGGRDMDIDDRTREIIHTIRMTPRDTSKRGRTGDTGGSGAP